MVAVQPYAHAPRRVRAELDERRAHDAIAEVQVDVVDVGARAAHRVAAWLPIALRRCPEHVGALLGDADEHDALATGRLGRVEVGSGDVLLAITLLEVHERDQIGRGIVLDRAVERGRPLAQDRVARDLLARLASEEPGQALGGLEAGHVAVEDEPVDALVAQRDVLVEQRVDVEVGQWRSSRAGMGTVNSRRRRLRAQDRSRKGMRPSPASAGAGFASERYGRASLTGIHPGHLSGSGSGTTHLRSNCPDLASHGGSRDGSIGPDTTAGGVGL